MMTPGPAGKSLAAADEGRIVVTMPEKWREARPRKPKEGRVGRNEAERSVFFIRRFYVRVAPVKEFRLSRAITWRNSRKRGGTSCSKGLGKRPRAGQT